MSLITFDSGLHTFDSEFVTLDGGLAGQMQATPSIEPLLTCDIELEPALACASISIE